MARNLWHTMTSRPAEYSLICTMNLIDTLRNLDSGGMLWERDGFYESMDMALQATKDFLTKFRKEKGW